MKLVPKHFNTPPTKEEVSGTNTVGGFFIWLFCFYSWIMMRRRKTTPRNIFKPLNSKKLDFRYVYLLFAWKDFSFKIGIATDAHRRRKDIDDDLKGRVSIIAKGEVLRARKYEQYLHKKFESDRFKQNGGRNAGNTEYFRLSLFEALQVCFLIKWQSSWRWLIVAVLIILVMGLNL